MSQSPATSQQALRLSVILPVMNETESLRETVRLLVAGCAAYLHEIVIVTSPRTTPESQAAIATVAHLSTCPIRVFEQQLPGLGGALREAFDRVSGDWVVMMASDLETDPGVVSQMVERMLQNDCDIVTASRWLAGGGFQDYGRLRLLLNQGFQILIARMYGVQLTDLTYGFRLFRTSIVQTIRWEEHAHPMLLETVVKPLRLGYRVVEVPAPWSKRIEGVSNNTFAYNIRYLRTALKNRFRPRHQLLRES
jgi:dolichol-phosphate mannosyltransferase